MGGLVVSVNVGSVRPAGWSGGLPPSAIDKRPVTGRVAVRLDRVAGDEHGDSSAHGGPDQAVYAYGREDAEHWERELDRPLPPGVFGENLTTAGVDVSGAVTGERWRVGETVLEVTTPRIPCRVFAGWWEIPDLVKRFTLAGRPAGELAALAVRGGRWVKVGRRRRAWATCPGGAIHLGGTPPTRNTVL